MKKLYWLSLCLIALAFLLAYLIPSIRTSELVISGSLPKVSSSVFVPKNWIDWDPETGEAWSKDSAACRFTADTARHTVTLHTPARTITVTQINYLFYRLDEEKNGRHAAFIFSVSPQPGDSLDKNKQASKIAYAEDSRWLYRLFPGLDKHSFAEKTLSELKSYLEDPAKFYGFDISLRPVADSLFLGRQVSMPGKDLFKKLPVVFDSLESFARQNQLQPGARNLSFHPLDGDSLEVRAAINIDRKVEGDYLHNFMQLPGHQYIAIARFEGPFRERSRIYSALEKYQLDHRLIKSGIPFERYVSPLPAADTSRVIFDLCYPIHN